MAASLRDQLVQLALQWQSRYGVAPAITSAISEFDAAHLIGTPEEKYATFMAGQTAVTKGSDFTWQSTRYQVKANRPSGKPGSFVTLVPKAKNYEWDQLIWILYDTQYTIKEAWLWDRESYISAFDNIQRLSPAHYRQGKRIVERDT